MDVLRKDGIEVPTMCHLPDTKPLTSCMLCVVKERHSGRLIPSCSTTAQDQMEIFTDDDEVHEARKMALELLLSDHVGECEAPCLTNCPSSLDIPLLNRLIAKGAWQEASRMARRDLAFPAILGRICPAPCERACRRKSIDDPVAICEIERFVGDLQPQENETAAKKNGKHVGIIGTGPAGLSASYFLMLNGYTCTLFDKNAETGGALRYAIPKDRLPDDVLDKEIERLKRLGATFKLNCSIAQDELLNWKKKYDALIIATGEDNASFDELKKRNKAFVTVKDTFETGIEGVFAIGSAIKPGRVAIRAVAHGKQVAHMVDQFLTGRKVVPVPKIFNSRFGKLLPEDHETFMMEADPGPRNAVNGAAGLEQIEVEKEAIRCMHCDCRAKDDCKLRIYADEYGASQSRYFPKHREPIRKISRFDPVVYEPEKCVKCGICVAITEMQQEELGLTYIGKGFDVEIGAPFNKLGKNALEKTASECAHMCPTAALALKENGYD